MKEFIEKLIGRLEKQAEQYRRRGFEHEQKGYSAMADKYYGKQCSYLHSIEIVNELAEEYKNTSIITDFLQYARDNADNYDTNEGWSLADLIDLSIKFTEEYSAKTPQNSAVNPTTNADRIRSMTDEELADFICGITEDGAYNTIIDDYCFLNSKEIEDWLKAERAGGIDG